MHNTIKKAATAQTGESVQTDAVPAQPQPPTAPDGTASETASDVAGAEATTTKSQSIAATPDQLAKDQTNSVFRSRMTGGKTITNDQLHKEAVKLLLARQATGTETKAKATAKSYNQRRREATEKLRPLLKEIWAAFNRGETVGGFTSKETWAAGQSIGIRWVQKIIAAPKPKQPKPEANSVRLTDGMAVEYNGENWCFDDGMLVKHCGEDKSDYSLMHAMDENHDELFSSNRKDCQEWLETMERSLAAKAQRGALDYEDDKNELAELRDQRAAGADEEGALSAEQLADMDERIDSLEESVTDYERKHPAKALAAAIDGATTCDNEVNSNEVV